MENSDLRMATLARIATLYYDNNKTQQEISEITGIARTGISRMIAEAREKGVVDIIVRYPWNSHTLEERLISAFGLKAARVMVFENETYEEMLRGLGVLAAAYLSQILRDRMVIGISWGSALYQMIKALQPLHLSDVEVVQLIGATGSESNLTDGPLLARLLASSQGASCRYLHAPLVVENKLIRDSLLEDRNIRETLSRANNADVALVGIGSIHSDLYTLKQAGYLTEAERLQLEESGVVGDVCGQHYKKNGEWRDIAVNDRVVGVDLNSLSKIETVIGVAGGEQKGDAILGALCGKLVDVLITDSTAAEYALRHA
jgi:DNA-binding transcriptional regulator LsrR (DeoR family)